LIDTSKQQFAQQGFTVHGKDVCECKWRGANRQPT